MKTKEDVEAIVARVTYPGFSWRVGRMGVDGFFVQIQYVEEDIDTGKPEWQHGRKWYVSSHATDGEVAQTMLKAAITSAEHRVREHFLVDGVRAFGPHLSLERLIEVAKEPEELRAPMAAAR
jgi:hypothetical protein